MNHDTTAEATVTRVPCYDAEEVILRSRDQDRRLCANRVWVF
jgi:hypothetical protein